MVVHSKPSNTLYGARFDVTDENYTHRIMTHGELLTSRGKFSFIDTIHVFMNPFPESKQGTARWLRKELKKLREDERKGKHSVGRGQALSRIEIADLAMTMVESLGDNIGTDLVWLLQELLNVDRHRLQLSRRCGEQFNRAAKIVAEKEFRGEQVGVRKLAKLVSVSHPTILGWLKRDDFRKEVERCKFVSRAVARLHQIMRDKPDISKEQAFNLAWLEESQAPGTA